MQKELTKNVQATFLTQNLSKTYIISGGGCAGKSTLITFLKSKGFQTIPEAFTHFCLKAEKEARLEEFWRDPSIREPVIMTAQIAWEAELNQSQVAFVDRSLLDSVFFANYYQNKFLPKYLIKAAFERNYASIVFFPELLPEKYFENTAARPQTRQENLKIHNFLRQSYRERGFTIIDVPFDTLENRASFILSQVELNTI